MADICRVIMSIQCRREILAVRRGRTNCMYGTDSTYTILYIECGRDIFVGERSARQDELYWLYIDDSLLTVGKIFCLFGEFHAQVCLECNARATDPLATDLPTTYVGEIFCRFGEFRARVCLECALTIYRHLSDLGTYLLHPPIYYPTQIL